MFSYEKVGFASIDVGVPASVDVFVIAAAAGRTPGRARPTRRATRRRRG
jgi:hypothetical protein